MKAEPSSKFIRVRCGKCKNEQVIFGKAAMTVVCLVCQEPMAESTGGRVRISAQVLEVLE